MSETEKERAPRKGGAPWTEDEQRLMWALREAGLKGPAIGGALNKHYNRSGKEARAEASVWRAFSTYKKMKSKVTAADRGIAGTITGVAVPKHNKPGRKSAADLAAAVADPAQLSPAAQKALEAKLAMTATVHRFKKETPTASIEVAVTGKGSEALFEKICKACL